MSAELNHTIVYSQDKGVSARFLAEILGGSEPASTPPFLAVALDNGVTLDFADAPAPITTQHYAFLVDDLTFDAAFGRIVGKKLDYWADPMLGHPGEINHRSGGRGVYFKDPSGHLLELLTRVHAA
jgi:catechol 2,3-dioxygenase-like lactoylglutathione lyase family enzyme